MTTLFSLPANILSNIYEMDTTFRNKFKEQINTEIWEKSHDIFRKKFINNPIFDDYRIINSKIDFLLRYLINNHFKEIMPDQLSIYISWKHLVYENNTVFIDDTGYNNIDEGRLYVNVIRKVNDDDYNHDIFQGEIYTKEQYNGSFGVSIDLNYGIRGGRMVLKNDEFVIVEHNSDNEDSDNEDYTDYTNGGYDYDDF